MRGLHPSPQTIPELGENLRTLTERVEECYYAREMVPGIGNVAGGAAFPAVPAGLDADYTEFPAGALSFWTRNFYLPEDWQAAGIYTKTWYTSPVGGGNNFDLRISARSFDSGSTLGALPVLFTQIVALPPPAGANGIRTAEDTLATKTFPRAQRPVAVRWTRRGDLDGNANALRVLLIYFRAWRVA
jgi:hypothetical protein